jgi:DnaD/phage-associated family protein
MPWIKLDDNWMDHPKIIRVGRDARDMWLASISWCAKHLTDGIFPSELLPTLSIMAGIDVANCQTFANLLLDACLWEIVDDKYQVHDYLDYNPSKEQAESTKTARKEAGKAGGVAKASKNVAKSKQNPSKTVAKSWQKSAPYPYPLNTTTTRETTETEDFSTQKQRPEIFSIYEKEIGILTPMIAEALIDAETEYPIEWFHAAFREAAANNKRNWKYAQAILKRWKIEGFQSKRKSVQNFRPKTSRASPAKQEPKYTPEQLLASLEATE